MCAQAESPPTVPFCVLRVLPLRAVLGVRRLQIRFGQASRRLRRRLLLRWVAEWMLFAHLGVCAWALVDELSRFALIVTGSLLGLALLEHLRSQARLRPAIARPAPESQMTEPRRAAAPSPPAAERPESDGNLRIRERLSRLAEDRASSVELAAVAPPPDVGDRAYSLRSRLDEVVRWMTPRAQRKRVRLSVLVGRGVPEELIGDPEGLQQIVGRMVHHAMGYTELGRVTVHVDVAWQSQDHVMLDFAVTDDGAGIPLREQCRIMGLVARVDEPSADEARDPDSLSVCAALVRKRGGTMEIDSDPGEGTTYRFTMCAGIQAARAHLAPPISGPPEDLLEGLSVLIVDGQGDRRGALRELCSSWNMRPTVIHDDSEMRMLIEAAENVGQPFDLVLLADCGRDSAAVTAEILRDFSAWPPGIVRVGPTVEEPDLRRAMTRAAAAAKAGHAEHETTGPRPHARARASHAA